MPAAAINERTRNRGVHVHQRSLPKPYGRGPAISFVAALALIPWLRPGVAHAQEQNLGAPIVTNYPTDKHGAHTQNWAAVQDERGLMYFANSDSILEYDGVRWRRIVTPRGTITRSLVLASDSVIYYGAVGDLGYLKRSDDGELVAASLLNAIPEADRTFNDVWQIEETSGGLYFMTRTRTFRLFAGEITVLPAKLAFSQAIVFNDTLFYADIDRGVCVIDRDRIVPLEQLSHIRDGTRVVMVPFGRHELLLGWASSGFYRIDLTALWDDGANRYEPARNPAGEIMTRFPTEFDSILTDNLAFMYKIAAIDADTFALATVRAGLFIFDRQGKIVRVINKHSGLQDNSLQGIFVDHSKNIWACTSFGVSHVELSVPQSSLDDQNGLDGLFVSMHVHDGRLYVGSMSSLFVQTPYRYTMQEDRPRYVALNGAPAEVWQFLEFDGDLMVASGRGLFRIQGDSAVRIPGSVKGYLSFSRSRRWPGYLFVGMFGGMEVFERHAGTWRSLGRVGGVTDNVRRITEDERGDLWLSTDIGGVLALRFSGNEPTKAETLRFGTTHGLPETSRTFVARLGRDLYALTRNGVYRATPSPAATDATAQIRFAPDPVFGKDLNDRGIEVRDMTADGNGGVLFNTSAGVLWFARQRDGSFAIDPRPFRGLQYKSDVFYRYGDSVWIPGKKLHRVDLARPKDYERPFPTVIREVLVGAARRPVAAAGPPSTAADSTRARAAERHEGRDVLPVFSHDQSSISFEFSASFYEKPGTTRFQYYLEGFDDDWSDWSTVASKEYTKIREGVYRFRVRAMNLYGTLGREAQYSFVIRPPWYRTTPAAALWLAAGLAAVAGVVYAFTRRLRRQRDHLEDVVAERTRQLYEVTITDPLTGLRNRRFITSVLQSDVNAFLGAKKHLLVAENARRRTVSDSVFGLFLIDLDHFKEVNDEYGHEAGDMVLKQLASLLTASVRGDDAVIRMGGEEFLVVLKHTAPEYLDVFAAKILDRVSSVRFDLGNARIQRTCSVGYASFPFYENHPGLVGFEQVIRMTDLGMYYAKKNGRDQAVFVRAGACTPVNEAVVQKSTTSLEYALSAGYLVVGPVADGRARRAAPLR